MDDVNFQKILEHVCMVHSHALTECTCGGKLSFQMQELCQGKDGYYDQMSYQCDTCKKIFKRRFDVPHLKGKL